MIMDRIAFRAHDAKQSASASDLSRRSFLRAGAAASGGLLLSVPKNSRCTGATVVMIAACGRASRDKGSISPAWFMPISSTQ